MPTMRLRNLRAELRSHSNNDNIHRIAISNLNDPLKMLERWWRKKYRTPPKDLGEYTPEELYVEYLEDYYDRHPDEAKRFGESMRIKETDGWDGRHNPALESQIRERLKKLKEADPVIIEKYRTPGDEEMSSEEFANILDSVGRKLPGSSNTTNFASDEDIEQEFDDVF